MANNDPNDFWGKGTPSGQPEDPNEGFWSSGKKKEEPKKEGGGNPPGGFWSKGGGKPAPDAGPEDGGWSKPKAPPPAPEPEGGAGFWNKAEESKKKAAEHQALPEEQKLRARKRRRRKIWLISLGSLLLLFIVFVALAPTIAGWVAPGIIESQADRQIVGKVKVDSASFGWWGPQRIQGVQLLDKDGKPVAKLSVDVSKGLTGFIFGNLDVGTVTLSGVKADVIRYADGSTNLEKAIAPRTPAKPAPAKPAPSKPSPTTVPDSLNAHVVARIMQVTFTDQTKPGAPAVDLKNADLDLKVGAGQPLSVVFTGDAESNSQGGKLAATIKADKLIRSDGLVQPEKATVDADISARSVPLRLVDTFAPLPQGASLEKGLGETIDVSIKANGSLKEAKATVAAKAANLSANADLRVADSVLTTQSPIDVAIKGQAIRTLVPAIDQSLQQAQSTATITTFPDAHLTVADLKFPIPAGGSLDLRGAAATIALAISETVGTVTLPGETAQPFRVAPLETRITTADLAKDVHVTAGTNATIDNKPAGTLSVDVTAAGLLGPNGAPVQGPPSSIRGEVAVKNIATVIAQPFVEKMNLNLPQDVGPTLDIEAKASSELHNAAPGATPSTILNVSVQSQNVKVAGAFNLSDSGLATSGDGLRVQVASAGAMASRFVGPDTGWRVAPAKGAAPGGDLTVTVKNLSVPRDSKGAVQLDKAGGSVDVAMAGLTVQSLKSPGSPPIELRTMTLGAQLASGGAKVNLDTALAYAGSNFGVQGNFDVPKLIAPAGSAALITPPLQLRPVGKLEIKNAPTALAGAFVPPASAAPAAKPAGGAQPAGGQPAAGAGGGGLDLARLISDTLGPSVNVALTTGPAQGAPDMLNTAVSVKTATTMVDVAADVGTTQVSVKTLSAQMNVTPQTVTGLTNAFAPGVSGAPRLAGPAKIVVQAEPISIPLKDFQPQLDRAGQAAIKLSIPGKTMVDGLTVTNEDGTKRDLGRVGIDSLQVSAKAPVAALVGPGLPGERKATVTLGGTVLGPDNAPMAELSGNVQTELSSASLAGPLAASFKVDKIAMRSVDRLANQPGTLTQGIGATASVGLTANIVPPAAKAGEKPDLSKATGDVVLTLDAPNVKTEGPIKVNLDTAAIRIDKPVKLTMEADPAFVNKMLMPKPQPGAPAGAAPATPAVRFTDPASISVSISNLVYPRPGVDSPAPLSAGLGLSIPSLKMVSSDNQPIRISQLAVQVKADPTKLSTGQMSSEVPVTFKVDVAEAAVGDQPPVQNMTLNGSVVNLLDSQARVNTKMAEVSAVGDLPVIPTAFVDAMAKQNGMLVDALGPVVTLKLDVERYPLGEMKPGGTPPVVQAQAKAQRADVELRGTIHDNVFATETPIKVTVYELTEAMAKRLVKGLPVIGTVEKTRQDAPGIVHGANMTVPLNNDMSKLNGEVTVDPGEARFGTAGAFASILKSVNQRQAGSLGQHLEPLHIDVKNGVATLQKWTIPIGEFNVQTEGTVDLVKRTLDVETWLPFGSLGEEALSSVKGIGGLGGAVLDAATMIPFKTSGSLDKPSTHLDTELFAKTVLKQLSPEDLLKKGVGDLLKNKVKGGG